MKISEVICSSEGLGLCYQQFLVADSNAQCFRAKWQQEQWRCLAKIASFNGSSGRCLIFSPLPWPTLPKKAIYTDMWLSCERGVGCTRCCAMSAALAPTHAIGGVAGVHTS
jgi:hypothetical protein